MQNRRLTAMLVVVVGLLALGVWHAHSGNAPAEPARAGYTMVRPDGGVVRARERTDGTCEHWTLPPVGSVLSYEVTGPGDVTGEADLQLESVEARSDEWDSRWILSIRLVEGPAARLVLDRRCHPERGAEDPWSGYLLAMPLMGARQGLWRWPREMVPGIEFGRDVRLLGDQDSSGTSTNPLGSSAPAYLTRQHVVHGREDVELPIGNVDAWRVIVTERAVARGHDIQMHGLLWVADGIGLVRAEYEWDSGEIQRWELADRGRPAAHP